MRPAVPATALTLAAVVQFGPAITGIPVLWRRAFPGAAGAGAPGRLSLTFDDGPHAEGTVAVLRVLAAYRSTATFFVIGEQAVRHPDLVRRIHGEGHQLAVHGWRHRPTPLTGPRRIRTELRDTAELIATLTGVIPTWYRPPYGVASGAALSAARSLSQHPVWWTRWARDWSRGATAADIADRATRSPVGGGPLGGTLLLHDSDTYGTPGSWRHTRDALPRILDTCLDGGIEVGALDGHTPLDPTESEVDCR